jgi:hypothetical protein
VVEAMPALIAADLVGLNEVNTARAGSVDAHGRIPYKTDSAHSTFRGGFLQVARGGFFPPD